MAKICTSERGASSVLIVLVIAVVAICAGAVMFVQNAQKQVANQKARQTLNTPKAASAPQVQTGSVQGELSYPAEAIPPLTVCAESTSGPAAVHCEAIKQTSVKMYTLVVPPGSYYIYAKLTTPEGDLKGYKAYYNKFVTCGMDASCPASSHKDLIKVDVAAGVTKTGINPTDWYAN